jgi:hypothetical protein
MLSRGSNAALIAGACLVGIGLGGAYQAAQQTPAIPAAVRSAIEKFFGPSTAATPEAKTIDGVTVYIASGTTKDGAMHWVTLSPAGDIQEDAKNISPNDLPKAISEKLKNKYPNAKIEEAQWRQLNLYTITFNQDGKKETANYFAAGNKWEPSHMTHSMAPGTKSETKKDEPKKDESKKETPKKP